MCLYFLNTFYLAMNYKRSNLSYTEDENACDWSRKQPVEKRKKSESVSDGSRKANNQKQKKKSVNDWVFRLHRNS